MAKKKNKMIVAVKSYPLQHVDFVLKNGSHKWLKVYVGHGPDIGKSFVQCDLCGTFITINAQHSLTNMQFHYDQKPCKDTRNKKEWELTEISNSSQANAAFKLSFNKPGSSRLDSDGQ
jgi:hypothetical protein